MINLVDVLDKNGNLTGKSVSLNEVQARGYWHAGVHALIFKNNREILIQKRTHEIIFHPDELDISVGGTVDSGEQPDQTMLREIKEEVGLSIPADKLMLISVTRYNHYWPSLKKKNRTIMYSYLVEIDESDIQLQVQPEEISWAKFISLGEAKKLIRKGRIKSLGKIEPTYAYYKSLISAMESYILKS